MKTIHRGLCIVIMVIALAATACGGDDKTTTTNNTTPTTVAVASAPAASTTTPSTVAQRVTDGAICPTPGARGVTERGIQEVCVTIAGGNETRWRPA